VRHARRTDANHSTVRDGLRGRGWDVLDLSDVGGGVPDLCVRSPTHHLPTFFEVKVLEGKRDPKPAPLTKEQEKWLVYCGSITYTVTSLEEALAILKRVYEAPVVLAE
jgi:hypothetical protein